MSGHRGHLAHVHRRADQALAAIGNLLGLGDEADTSPDTQQQYQVMEPRDVIVQPKAETVVSVVYMTATPTFTGQIGGYSTQGQAINTREKPAAPVKPSPTTQAVAVVNTPSTSRAITTDVETASSVTSLPTAIVAADTDLPTSVSLLAATNPLPTSTTPSTVNAAVQSVSATSSATPHKSSSMSAGGLVGIIIGVLLLIGAILSIVLFCFKKRRNKMKREQVDDEKDPFGDAASVDHSPPSQTPKTAPRLSLRPVTQFLPYGSEKHRSAAIPLASTTTPEQNRNNPFGNHAETIDHTNVNGPPVMQGLGPSGGEVEASKAAAAGAGAITGATAVAAGAALTRGASKRDVNKPMDFTKSGPLGPPSPTGTDFSESPDTATAPTQTNTSAAIAAAGGPSTTAVHRVQMDFKPSMDDELDLRVGQLIRLLHEYDDGWAMCIRLDRSQQGVVPRTCLSMRPVKPRPKNGPPATGPRQGPRGPGMNQGPPYPMGPGMSGPPRGPMGQPSRLLTPGMQGPPMSPMQNQGAPRSMSPAPLRPSTPNGQGAPRPMTPIGAGIPRSLTPQGAPRPMTPTGQDMARSMTPTGQNMMRSTTPTILQAARPTSPKSPYASQPNVSPRSERSLPSIPQNPSPTPTAPQSEENVSPVSNTASSPVLQINRKPLPGQAL